MKDSLFLLLCLLLIDPAATRADELWPEAKTNATALATKSLQSEFDASSAASEIDAALTATETSTSSTWHWLIEPETDHLIPATDVRTPASLTEPSKSEKATGLLAVYFASKAIHLCSATAVSPRHILTAAHCFKGPSRAIAAFFVPGFSATRLQDPRLLNQILKIHWPLAFDGTGWADKDIALATLDRPVQHTLPIKSFPLGAPPEESSGNQYTTAGYSRASPSGVMVSSTLPPLRTYENGATDQRLLVAPVYMDSLSSGSHIALSSVETPAVAAVAVVSRSLDGPNATTYGIWVTPVDPELLKAFGAIIADEEK
ncbi:MAG: trypsin-like serine protease [Pseudobdellovibrionaceae bacterium]|nr:trypsin-like serine protease [Bdellovibrionales bacterium]USN47966.1 MAG: trypsin-like serine protease [Pseudobdellovibrionaceae bacterium]